MKTRSANESNELFDRPRSGVPVAQRSICLRGAGCVFCILGLAAIGGTAAAQVPATVAGSAQGVPRTKAIHRAGRPRTVQASRPEELQHHEEEVADQSVQTAKAAVVTLQGGLLTVQADNSDLRQILDNIGALGSMSIDGQISDTRVYGSYGPAVPSAVISNLLEGAGYNVILAGINRLGVPRKLVLTPKTGGASPPSAPVVAAPSNPPEGSEGNASDGETPGPGAIANTPPPPSDDPAVRLKQTIDRLQQMHDQQKQPQEPK